MQNQQGAGQNYEPRTVSLPKAQLEDLNMIRNEWGKIVRDMGMSIRPSFRETVVEPAGDSCLCIVFNDPMNFAIGSRPSVLGDLERYVEQKYGKSLYFKSRVRESGERMDTRYISDDELRKTSIWISRSKISRSSMLRLIIKYPGRKLKAGPVTPA